VTALSRAQLARAWSDPTWVPLRRRLLPRKKATQAFSENCRTNEVEQAEFMRTVRPPDVPIPRTLRPGYR